MITHILWLAEKEKVNKEAFIRKLSLHLKQSMEMDTIYTDGTIGASGGLFSILKTGARSQDLLKKKKLSKSLK